MSTVKEPAKPHSGEYFGETRDYWWNADFLALMARRWRADTVRSVLDVGCGMGHWGQTLLAHLHPEVRLVGVDREAEWVSAAAKRAASRGLGARCRYRLGDVAKLPFHDAQFDLVTCQTVLIHVPDVAAALREMARVCKPGGLLAVCEPNNLAGSVLADSTLFDAGTEELVALYRFQLVCERGKAALGEGHNSVGGALPARFARMGLAEVQVYLSDKASWMAPPYDSPEQRALVAEARGFAQRPFWIWDERDTRRFFLAGGGAEGEFELEWARALATSRARDEAMAQGTFDAGGGGIAYLVSGRVPLE